jgi:cyclic pyranopterin phosphate synthase
MPAKEDEKSPWSHVDPKGDARMVDVSGKAATLRRAVAVGALRLKDETRRQIVSGESPKGSVLGVARVAGIQAAKETSRLIPLCHPLPVEKVRVDFSWAEGRSADEARLEIEAEVTVTAKTGVEMEALTAVAVAALTVYDMVKGVEPGIVIEEIRLLEKKGGKSDYSSP